MLASIPGYNQIVDSEKSRIYNLLWVLIIFASCIICCYQIYERVSYFLSTPTENKITITRNSTVKFPSITVCAPLGNHIPLIPLMKSKADREKVNLCAIDVKDLLGISLNITNMWDLMTVKEIIKVVFELKANGQPPSKNPFFSPRKSLKTHSGVCLEYKFGLKKFKKDNFIVIFALKSNLPFCTKSFFLMFAIHEDFEELTYNIINEMKHIYYTYNYKFGITARQIKVLNRTGHPCDSIEIVNECQKNCLEKELKKIISCRLPFMSLPELPYCTNKNDSTESHASSFKFAADFDYEKACFCPRKCKETLYTINLKLMWEAKGDLALLAIYFSDNLIETITEHYSYTFIPLMCDIGGNLGLFLGLCILSVFQIVESLIEVSIAKIRLL